MECDIRFNFALNRSDYMRNLSLNNFIIMLSKHLTSDNGVYVLFCFLKILFVLGHQESDFQSPF